MDETACLPGTVYLARCLAPAFGGDADTICEDDDPTAWATQGSLPFELLARLHPLDADDEVPLCRHRVEHELVLELNSRLLPGLLDNLYGLSAERSPPPADALWTGNLCSLLLLVEWTDQGWQLLDRRTDERLQSWPARRLRALASQRDDLLRAAAAGTDANER